MQKSKRKKSNLIKASQVIDSVIKNLGIENNLKVNMIREIWPLITSFEIAKNSQPAYFDKDQKLVINVKNPSLATELSMQKTFILEKLLERAKELDIVLKDIRFIIKSNNL